MAPVEVFPSRAWPANQSRTIYHIDDHWYAETCINSVLVEITPLSVREANSLILDHVNEEHRLQKLDVEWTRRYSDNAARIRNKGKIETY